MFVCSHFGPNIGAVQKVQAVNDAGQIQDKRLRIVVCMLRPAVHEEPRVALVWQPTYRMVADGLTKIIDTAFVVIETRQRAMSALVATLATLPRCRGELVPMGFDWQRVFIAEAHAEQLTSIILIATGVFIGGIMMLLFLGCVFFAFRQGVGVVPAPSAEVSALFRPMPSNSPDHPLEPDEAEGEPYPNDEASEPAAAAAVPTLPVPKAEPKAKPRTRFTYACPKCTASPMLRKAARRGGWFYGCHTWPVCNGSRRPNGE